MGEERLVRMLCVEVAAKLRPLRKAERLSQRRVVAQRGLVAAGCPFTFPTVPGLRIGQVSTLPLSHTPTQVNLFLKFPQC